MLHRAIVHDRAQLGGHLLSKTPGKSRRALAVEIALQPVTDRFVQQHAGPARSEHDGHLAGRGRHGLQVQ